MSDEIVRTHGTLTLDSSDYNRGIDQAESRMHSFGSAMVGSLTRIGEVATGVFLAQAIPSMINGLKGLAAEGLAAVASYERLDMSLTAIGKKDLINAATTEKMVKVGEQVVTVTAAQTEKVRELSREREIMGIRIQEETLKHAELVKRYGEEGLATRRHALQMQGMQEDYAKLGAEIDKLGVSKTRVVAQFEKVTSVALTEEQALKMAAEQSKEMLAWIEKLAVESPFETSDVADAFKMTMAYGFMSNSAADLSVQTGKLTAEQRKNTITAERMTQAMMDFASGSGASGESMRRIALALGQIQAKGKVAGQEVLQLTNVGLSVDRILAKAFGKTTDEIVKMREKGLIKADEAIKAIVETLEKDFGGAAKRQTQTFAGLISTMKDLKSIGIRDFFSGIFKAIQPYLAQFVGFLTSDRVKTGIKQIGEALGSVLKNALAFLSTLFGLINRLRTAGDDVRKSVTAMADLRGWLARMGITEEIITLLGKIGESFGRLKDTVLGMLSGLKGGGGGVTILDIVNRAIKWLVDNWDAVEGALKGIGTVLIAGGVLGALSTLAGALLSLVNPFTLLITIAGAIGAAWSTNFMGIRDTVQPILDRLVEVFGQIVTKVQEVIAAFQTGGIEGGIMQLLGLSQEQMDSVSAFFETVGRGVQTFFQAFQAGASGDAKQVFDVVQLVQGADEFGQTVARVGLEVGQTFDTIRTKVGEVVAAFQEGGLKGALLEVGIPPETMATLERVGQFLSSTFGETLGRIRDAWGTMVAGFADFGPKLEPLMAAFRKLWEAIQPVVTLVAGVLVGAFNLLLEVVANVMAGLPGYVENAVNVITGIINVLAEIIQGVVDFVTAIFEGDWAGAWETVKETVANVDEYLKNIFNALLSTIGMFVEDVIQAVVNFANNFIAKAKEIFGIASPSSVFVQIAKDILQGLIDGIASMASTVLTNVVEFFETNIKRAMDFATLLVDAGKQIVNGLWEGIKGMGEQFAAWIIGWLKTWVPAPVLKFLGIESPSRMFYEIGQQIVQGLIEGIRSLGPAVMDAMIGTLQGVLQTVSGMVQVLDQIDRSTPVTDLLGKLAGIIAGFKQIVVVFHDLARYYGSAAGGLALRSAKAVLEPLAEIANALGAVIRVMTDISEMPNVTDMRGQLDTLRRVIVAVVDMFALIADSFTGAQRERLKNLALEMGLIMAPLAEVFLPLRDALDFMTYIEGARIPDVGRAIRSFGSSLTELVQVLAGVVEVIGVETLRKAGQVAEQLSGVLVVWLDAVEVVNALATYTDRTIGTKANQLAGKMRRMALMLVDWANTLDKDVLEKAVKVAEQFRDILAPWRDAIDVVAALADYTDRVIGTKANQLAGKMRRLALMLVSWADTLDPGVLQRATEVAAQFEAILAPWQQVIDVVGALATYTDRVIGTTANQLAGKMRRMALMLVSWADTLDPATLQRATEVAAQFQAVLAPWQQAIDVVNALADHVDQVIGPKANRLASQMLGLARNLQQWADQMTPAQMARAVAAANNFSATLEPWQKAVDVVAALSKHVDRVIGPIADRLASQMMGLARNLQQWADHMTPAEMQRAVEAAGNFVAILQPWEQAIAVVRMLKAWKWLPDLDDKFARLLRFWQDAIDKLIKVAVVVDRDGLTAVVRFSAALRDVAEGLRAALELALELPDHWEVPDAWDAFQQWVMDTFEAFYRWVNRTATIAVAGGGTVSVPAFSDEGLGAVTAFANALGALMGALMDALELSLALPATWAVPPAWDAFVTWVQSVFQGFYDWITGWGDDPPVPRFGDDELDLMALFADTLATLMDALQSALAVATALPAGWTVPAAWGAFEQWVRDVFLGFASWLLGWGDPPVPLFNEGQLDLIGQFAAILSDLMSALQAALAVATGLPSGWAVPAAWGAFEQWVRDVFMGFASWLLGWGNDPVVPLFTEGQLDLIGQFAGAMNALFGGLQAALVVASGLPVGWQAPGATWDAFVTWVQDTMEYFITYVANYLAQHPSTTPFQAVTEFGNAMQAVFGGLLAALELFASINTWVGPGSTFQTRLDTFLGLVETTFSTLETYVRGNFTTVALQLMSTFGSALSTVVGSLSASLQLFSALAGTEPGIFTPGTATLEFERRIEALMMAIGITITAFQTYVATAPNQLWFPTAQAFFGAVDLMMGILSSALDLFADLENANLPNPQQIQDFVDAVLTLFTAFATGLLNTGGNIGTTAGDIQGTVAGMPGGILAYADPFSQAGSSTIGSLAGGMVAGSVFLQDSAAGVYQEITILRQWLVDRWTYFEGAGIGLISGLATGLTDSTALATIAGAGTTALNSLWDAWNPEASQAGVWAGQQAGSGIVTGLQNRSGAVYNAAYALAQQILAGLNAGLIIGSPSRRTAQIGAWAGEGLIDGFESKTDRLAASVTGMVGGMVSPMQTLGLALVTAFAGGMGQGVRSVDRVLGVLESQVGGFDPLSQLAAVLGPQGGLPSLTGGTWSVSSERRVLLTVDFQGADYLPPSVIDTITREIARAVRLNA